MSQSGPTNPTSAPPKGGLILPHRNHLPRLGKDVYIAPTATVIGDVEIGDQANIWFSVVIRGDDHEIRIGARTNIQDGTIVHITGGVAGDAYPTHIGADVTIGHAAVIHGCTLEDRCLISMSATVLDGAVVEEGAMVAAGALVAPGKRVKAGELWAGVPARRVRELTAEERTYMIEVPAHYVKLAAEYLAAP
ncbi:MAG: gamma carbonic anhydrase family protein [Alphaproteobacteria bacterium]|nr:gamma carbonic anhydrase family protein [Pseudomonadota bacterium]MCZ6744906.1 gamma carbonic anhydrase family protein [Alphaproteobacteria bacterium]